MIYPLLSPKNLKSPPNPIRSSSAISGPSAWSRLKDGENTVKMTENYDWTYEMGVVLDRPNIWNLKWVSEMGRNGKKWRWTLCIHNQEMMWFGSENGGFCSGSTVDCIGLIPLQSRSPRSRWGSSGSQHRANRKAHRALCFQWPQRSGLHHWPHWMAH